jgi:hypothetical protein
MLKSPDWRSRLSRIWKITLLALRNLTWVVIGVLILGRSSLAPADASEHVRVFTRNIEFDFVTWTWDAVGLKISQGVLDAQDYMDAAAQHRLVLDYLDLIAQANRLNNEINLIFADPQVKDPQAQSADQRTQLAEVNAQISQKGPVVEEILQSQLSQVAAEQGLTLGGQPVPPVLYHATDLPLGLVISPRTVIRADQDFSLNAPMSAADKDALEKQIETSLDVSSLVVEIGGIGIYPTMVESSSDLQWVTEVVAHEWTHNFLTLRPLGINYGTNPDLRNINETTASLVGRELGLEVLKRFYPERVPAPPPPAENKPDTPAQPKPPPTFSYRGEMHETRVTVDRLLAEGRVKDAEDYMEERRQLFWAEGYQIRRLNQAYFAFYGAYNDVSPGGNSTGQAGRDPVGPAVAALRQKSASLAAFLNRISWMTSFEQLQKAVQP